MNTGVIGDTQTQRRHSLDLVALRYACRLGGCSSIHEVPVEGESVAWMALE